MITDFRNIDWQEELSAAESGDMLTPDHLVDRVLARRNALDNGISLPWAKLQGLIKLREGEIVMLGGYSGHFKSTISTQIALSALAQNYRVGIASLELLAEDVIEQMVEIGAGRMQPPDDYVRRFASWGSDKLFIYDRTDSIRPDEAIQMTIAFAKYRGCKLVVLDALMMMGVTDDVNKEAEFTRALAAVAKRFKVCILLVHHVRKPMGDGGEKRVPGKYDFIGSSHLVNIASTILMIWHNKDKAYQKNAGAQFDDLLPDLLVKVAKQRNHHYEGVTGYWQHDSSRGFCETSNRKLEPIDQHWGGR